MSETTSTHAHDLYDLVASRPEGWLPAELKAAVSANFGEDARFHTCSQSELSLRDLVDFAFTSGRLTNAGTMITLGSSTCSH